MEKAHFVSEGWNNTGISWNSPIALHANWYGNYNMQAFHTLQKNTGNVR